MRLIVLERAGHRCEVVDVDGNRCEATATDSGHWPIAKADGGPTTLDNLRAECEPHNSAGGAEIAARRRRARATPRFFRAG